MSRMTFLDNLLAARRGDRVIYHTGLLLFDRNIGADFMRIHNVAAAAYEAYQQGKVRLFQQRVQPNVFNYIAEKI